MNHTTIEDWIKMKLRTIGLGVTAALATYATPVTTVEAFNIDDFLIYSHGS